MVLKVKLDEPEGTWHDMTKNPEDFPPVNLEDLSRSIAVVANGEQFVYYNFRTHMWYYEYLKEPVNFNCLAPEITHWRLTPKYIEKEDER